jgi:hypothetical protein
MNGYSGTIQLELHTTKEPVSDYSLISGESLIYANVLKDDRGFIELKITSASDALSKSYKKEDFLSCMQNKRTLFVVMKDFSLSAAFDEYHTAPRGAQEFVSVPCGRE